MRRGGSMVPPFFIWIFQDYPEVAAYFLRTLNPVILNVAYDKLSGMFLSFAVDLLLDYTFPNNWIKGIIKKAVVFSYNKYVIPIIFSSKLPIILRRRGLTPEEMLEPAEFAILEKEDIPGKDYLENEKKMHLLISPNPLTEKPIRRKKRIPEICPLSFWKKQLAKGRS
ncbi:hypothetical protein C1645_814127 [Glomus cerebriforme]|uniref:Uncharacterized protein n=1 Tax=Glomus cerebriforme TaxID=658196 RepID=A0A397THL9_9GLOM|nr:hypothetical protein C1645_814127 [Glomus cerebriforme]